MSLRQLLILAAAGLALLGFAAVGWGSVFVALAAGHDARDDADMYEAAYRRCVTRAEAPVRRVVEAYRLLLAEHDRLHERVIPRDAEPATTPTDDGNDDE